MERRFADSGRQGGYYRWLPTVELYELLQQTNSLWEEVDEPGKSQSDKNSIYAWIGDEGVGNAAVAACLNDGIFFSMIPAEAWGGVDFYAPIAFALNVKDQSTNAMSNWGVAYFLQGNFELAKVAFEIALDRDDKFADDEASFYLSKIYEQEGDLLKSEEYRKRCEAAGGYEPTYI
jgi:tetratricopeptide (TPR) repeat protein